jgi:hypothetical protein
MNLSEKEQRTEQRKRRERESLENVRRERLVERDSDPVATWARPPSGPLPRGRPAPPRRTGTLGVQQVKKKKEKKKENEE